MIGGIQLSSSWSWELLSLGEAIEFDLEEAFDNLTDKDFFSEKSSVDLESLKGDSSANEKPSFRILWKNMSPS